MWIKDYKRGDSFFMTCWYTENGAPADVPTAVRAQLRDGGDALVAELTFTSENAAEQGRFTLTLPAATDPTTFPVGILYCDLQYTYPDGHVSSTYTFGVNVLKDITHD